MFKKIDLAVCLCLLLIITGCAQYDATSNVNAHSALRISEVRFPYPVGPVSNVSLGPISLGFGDSSVRGYTRGWFVMSQGGYGGSYITTSPLEGIHLACTYGGLSFIKIGWGWKGSTDRGIKLGSTKKKVKEAYPETTSDFFGNLVWKIDKIDNSVPDNPTRWCVRDQITFKFMFDRLSGIRINRKKGYIYKGRFTMDFQKVASGTDW